MLRLSSFSLVYVISLLLANATQCLDGDQDVQRAVLKGLKCQEEKNFALGELQQKQRGVGSGMTLGKVCIGVGCLGLAYSGLWHHASIMHARKMNGYGLKDSLVAQSVRDLLATCFAPILASGVLIRFLEKMRYAEKEKNDRRIEQMCREE